jgi:hypothetical protein
MLPYNVESEVDLLEDLVKRYSPPSDTRLEESKPDDTGKVSPLERIQLGSLGNQRLE